MIPPEPPIELLLKHWETLGCWCCPLMLYTDESGEGVLWHNQPEDF